MNQRFRATVGAVFLLAAVARPAFAAPGDLVVAECTEATADVEAADSAFVGTVATTFHDKGPQGAAADLPALVAVLARHKDLHRIERCGGVVHVNSGDPQDALFAEADMVGTVTKATASSTHIDATRSYVVSAAYLAGFIAADRNEYERAAVYLRQGLAISPYYPPIVSEAANVFALAGRVSESVAVIDVALEHQPNQDLTPGWHGALLRRKGFALGELARWDEAEAAYNESLKWAPSNANALNELKYIAQRKAGGAAAPVQQTVTDITAATATSDTSPK